MQHASILGYLEPVSAPLYAFLLIGESAGAWTLAGGAVIIVAGVLVILFGERDDWCRPRRRRPPAERTPARRWPCSD